MIKKNLLFGSLIILLFHFTIGWTKTDLGDGYKKFSGIGVEIFLPETFVSGNPSHQLDLAIKNLKNEFPNLDTATIEKMMEAQKPDTNLMAKDNKSDTSFIIKECKAGDAPFNEFLERYVEYLPIAYGPIELLKNEYFKIKKFNAAKIYFKCEFGENPSLTAQYFVETKNKVFLLQFSTNVANINRRLSIFEKCINTFELTN